MQVLLSANFSSAGGRQRPDPGQLAAEPAPGPESFQRMAGPGAGNIITAGVRALGGVLGMGADFGEVPGGITFRGGLRVDAVIVC